MELKSFGLNELKQGYFPHYFNKECHKIMLVVYQQKKKHYGYNQMKSDEREKFLKWYEECVNNGNVFDFNEELIEYCRYDVDILRRSMIKFSEGFITLENIDPLRYITIASFCMAMYRAKLYASKNNCCCS